MKKKSRIVGNHIHRKYLVIGILSSILLSIAIGFNLFSNQQLETKAHPTQSITLDAGTANEFVVSPDATKLVEPALIGNPDFEGYVQNNHTIPILTKGYMQGYGSEMINGVFVSANVIDIRETAFGNYIAITAFAGNGRGGLIAVDVYNSDGKLISSKVDGDLGNVEYRSSNFISSFSDNSFLLLTSGGRYVKYSITSETSSSATIEKIDMIQTTRPQRTLNAEMPLQVKNLDQSSESLVSTRIRPNASNLSGIVHGKLAIGELNATSWQTTDQLSDVNYRYSLDNLTISELNMTDTSAFFQSNLYKYGKYLYGEVGYTANSAPLETRNTIQIFDTTSDVTDSITGKLVKKRLYSYVPNSNTISTTILKNISDNNYLYYMENNNVDSKIIEVDLSNFSERVVRTFPLNTRIDIYKNLDGSFSYYGSTRFLDGEFYSDFYSNSLNSTYYFVSGIMNEITHTPNDLKINSIRAFEVGGLVIPSITIPIDNSRYIIGGTISNSALNFLDKSSVFDSANSIGTGKASGNYSFVGNVTVNDDYSPILNIGAHRKEAVSPTSISINIEDRAISSPVTSTIFSQWTSIDQWLITGTKNGTLDDEISIKVYDSIDSNDEFLELNWLTKRINLNPKQKGTNIDWIPLGFDKTKSGPQSVTYFITDSQSQATSSSRWVNKKTNQTIEKDNYFFDAHNFAVPLSEVKSSLGTEELFKKLAKSMAWNGTTGQVDEDSVGVVAGDSKSIISTKVTIDQTQLQAVREATIARPYPVDMTYTPAEGDPITNRVWVFLTTKNTVVDTTSNIVFYGNDYTIPWSTAKNQTEADVLSMGDIKIYDFKDSTHETDETGLIDANGNVLLPPLADKDNPTGLSLSNLPVITEANITKTTTVQPEFVYTDTRSSMETTTTGTIDVTIYSSIFLHVRQVVLNSTDQLVIPKDGYITFENKGGEAATSVDTVNQTVPSGSDSDNPDFSEPFTITLDTTSSKDQLLAKVVLPEYYSYLGYVESNTAPTSAFPHTQNDLTGTGDFDYTWTYDSFEKWVTLYIQPTSSDDPAMYSWNYALNDFGTIQLK